MVSDFHSSSFHTSPPRTLHNLKFCHHFRFVPSSSKDKAEKSRIIFCILETVIIVLISWSWNISVFLYGHILCWRLIQFVDCYWYLFLYLYWSSNFDCDCQHTWISLIIFVFVFVLILLTGHIDREAEAWYRQTLPGWSALPCSIQPSIQDSIQAALHSIPLPPVHDAYFSRIEIQSTWY